MKDTRRKFTSEGEFCVLDVYCVLAKAPFKSSDLLTMLRDRN